MCIWKVRSMASQLHNALITFFRKLEFNGYWMAYFCRKKTSLARQVLRMLIIRRGLNTGEILSKLLGKKRRKIGELIYYNDLTN